jgi:hypothetical protein
MSVQGKQINVPMAGALILFAIVAAVAVGYRHGPNRTGSVLDRL